MKNFEQQQTEANSEKQKKNEIEITKEQIVQRIHKMKCEADDKDKVNAINLHLKNIDEKVLLTSLEDSDYDAFKKAFNNEWMEDSEEFKKYEDDVLEWKRKERMDSGASAKLKVRRDFAAMIRNYVVDLTAELKKKK